MNGPGQCKILVQKLRRVAGLQELNPREPEYHEMHTEAARNLKENEAQLGLLTARGRGDKVAVGQGEARD